MKEIAANHKTENTTQIGHTYTRINRKHSDVRRCEAKDLAREYKYTRVKVSDPEPSPLGQFDNHKSQVYSGAIMLVILI